MRAARGRAWARRLTWAAALLVVACIAVACLADRVITYYAGPAPLAPEDAPWIRSPAAQRLADAAFADLNGAPVVDHAVALLATGARLPGAPAHDSRRLGPGGLRARLDRTLADRAARHTGGRTDRGAPDARYISYLLRQMAEMPGPYRAVISGRDAAFDPAGQPLVGANPQIIDNDYAVWLAGGGERPLIPAVSIHPRAPNATQQIRRQADAGIRRLTWWPGPQHIRPDSAGVRAITPVLVDTGMQVSLTVGAVVDRLGHRAWIAPVSVTSLLQAGVPVELRLGGALGEQGQSLMAQTLALLRAEPGPAELSINLGGLITRADGRKLLVGLLQHPEFYDRLVYGSGYPESVVAERVRIDRLVADGLITPGVAGPLAELRQTNPLLFVYVLHRQLRLPGTDLTLPAAVFTAGG